MLCNVCGRVVHEGMTDADASFYCHELCFLSYMDRTYGHGKWMALGNNEMDKLGGYYITTADVPGGYQGTGIYFTEFDD